MSRIRLSEHQFARNFSNPLRHAIDILQLTFPNHQHAPSVAPKPPKVPPVAGRIAQPLFLPVRGVGLWRNPRVAAGVHVPKAAMHIDDFAKPGKNDVGCAGKIAAMKPEAIAEAMHQSPDDHFRLGVAGLTS